MEVNRRHVLGLVFLTVFLDMVGFSIIFPLFPTMLEHYVGLEGSESLIGRLIAKLSSWVGDRPSADFGVMALFGGVLGSLYSLLQFLFSPFWGALSDRIGRRPTLLVTLAGTTLSYVVWIFAGTFALLVVARLLGGMMAGNISTASAAIADTHSGPERAKGMGILGAGIGLGFVVGPALGAFFSTWDLRSTWPAGEAYGINPFSACALAAFGLAFANLFWAWRKFPETRKAATSEQERTLHPFRALREIDYPGVRRTNLAYFLYLIAFGAMEFTLAFLATERLGFGPKQNGMMFVFVGVLIALVQGGFVRRLVPKLGERAVAKAGLLLTLPGFLIVGSCQSVAVLYVGLFFLAFGSALVMPCLSSLVSRYTVDEGRQGLALGVFRSLGSLARAVGPILGGLLYWRIASWGPYYLGAAALLVPVALAWALPAIPDAPESLGETSEPG
ncbi:MAG: MFS transporter [bacterium]|nr:MFS transporter [bacterium]